MKNSKFKIAAALAFTFCIFNFALSQPVPSTTAFTRWLLNSTNQAQALERLGISSTGVSPAEVAAIMATNTAGYVAGTLSNSVTGNAATATGATNANFAATAIDPDAAAYLVWVGRTNSQYRDRVINGFVELKNIGLWTNLIDGAALGYNLNISNTYWGTLKLRYGTNVGNPAIEDDGLRFTGVNRAYVRNLPDMRTNTMIVTYQGGTAATNAIIALQSSTSSNGSIAIIGYPYVGSPLFDARDIDLYYGGFISAGQATSNAIPSWNSQGHSAFNDEEHYLAFGVDGQGKRAAWLDGYCEQTYSDTTFTITNTVTSLNLAAFLAGDANAPSSGMFSGKIKSWFVFDRKLTTNEVRQVLRAIRWFDVREEQDTFVGDSLTSSYDLPPEQGTFFTNVYPYQLMLTSTYSNRSVWRNFGQASTFTYDWEFLWYTNRVQTWRPGGAIKKSRVWYRLGANDLIYGAAGAGGAGYVSTAINSASNFMGQARRDGFEVHVLNVIPITNSFGGQLSNDTPRLVFNRAIETNALWYSRLWKVDELLPDMRPLASGGIWSTDGTHPTFINNRAIAYYVASGGSSMTSTGEWRRVNGMLEATRGFYGNGANITNAPPGYSMVLMGGWPTGTPADATTYYAGADPLQNDFTDMTTYQRLRVRVPRAGTIKYIFLKVRMAVYASTETVSHYLRLNDTTDFGQIDIVYNGDSEYSSVNSSVSQVVATGDYLALKIVTPTWVSNPSGVRWYALVYIE